MKYVSLVFAAASLLTVMPAAPAAADTSTADYGIPGFCQVDVPTNHPDLPLGNCVSLLSTNFRDNAEGLAPHLCTYVETAHPDEFDAYYDSYVDCVRDGASAFL